MSCSQPILGGKKVTGKTYSKIKYLSFTVCMQRASKAKSYPHNCVVLPAGTTAHTNHSNLDLLVII